MKRFVIASTSMLLGAALTFAAAFHAQAAFVAIDSQQVEDTATGLVWLADWGTAAANDWQTQLDWAAGLTIGGVVPGTWSVPTLVQLASVWNDSGASLTGLSGPETHFIGVEPARYWTSTEWEPQPAIGAWFGDTTDGSIGAEYKGDPLRATAVRLVALPEPRSAWMLALGLGLLFRLRGRLHRPAPRRSSVRASISV